MPWHTIWPEGGKSVRANRTFGNENMAYINDVMGGNDAIGSVANTTPDHFWSNNPYDRHHRYIQMPGFVDAVAAPTNPFLSPGMNSVLYSRFVNADVGRYELFHKNQQDIYQLSPSFQSTVINITSGGVTWDNILAVPANVYGEIFAVKDSPSGSSPLKMSYGFFYSDPTSEPIPIVRAYAVLTPSGSALDFRSTGSTSLMIQAHKLDNNQSGNYRFYITYRAR